MSLQAQNTILEKQIYEIIFRDFSDKAVLFITHQLFHLNKFDKIYVLDKGKIVEEGSHSVLINNGETCQRLLER